jgi:hypothetical protein
MTVVASHIFQISLFDGLLSIFSLNYLNFTYSGDLFGTDLIGISFIDVVSLVFA